MKPTRFICLVLLLPALIQLTARGPTLLAYAEEDEIDNDDDAGVEDDEAEADVEAPSEDEESEDESDEALNKNVSPDADTLILFTKPVTQPGSVELPAGNIVEFLVGFTNKGDEDFIIDTLDASFRYPMDFTFHIQNFSAIAYQKVVKPKEQATVAYSFIPADAFAGRPIGLSINLAYRSAAGDFYVDPVFNETVQIVEFDEGFDSQTFFMWIFLVAGIVLVIFLIVTQVGSPKKKGFGGGPKGLVVETGTGSDDDVDYEWIPRANLPRTPASGKTSPRQRNKVNGKRTGPSSDTE